MGGGGGGGGGGRDVVRPGHGLRLGVQSNTDISC